MSPSQSEPRIEAAIVIRIDNMDAQQTVGQRSIRFALDVSKLDQASIEDFVRATLAQAPPVSEWSRY